MMLTHDVQVYMEANSTHVYIKIKKKIKVGAESVFLNCEVFRSPLPGSSLRLSRPSVPACREGSWLGLGHVVKFLPQLPDRLKKSCGL